MDYEHLAAELLRALRGKRSRAAVAKRLGCRPNAIYTWEAGRNFPTAARTFRVARRLGVDVHACLQRFYGKAPAWLEAADVAAPETITRLIDDLRGRTTIVALAASTGRSRFAVSRWLKGGAQPRLPDFLRLIEASSLRLLDFVAAFVDPSSLPSVRQRWLELEATRRAAYGAPWSHAFLRALELSDYRQLARHQPGWLARRLGLPAEEEARCLTLLEATGQIALDHGRYAPARILTVDTRRDPDAGQRLRRFWAEAAVTRIDDARDGAYAYNLCGVSRADMARLRELQRAYFRELRAIVVRSQPVEVVALATMQLVPLG
jgi:transcriptional regulator with XRE-family HTH domain